MELKKSSKADLEGKRNTFFLIGLVVALSMALMAFEWSGKPKKAEFQDGTRVDYVEDLVIPSTRERQVTPPPPKIIETFDIVGNDVDIVDDIFIEDSGADENTIIDIPDFVQANMNEVEPDEIFIHSEVPAKFPGGERALYRYISEHVNYPVIAQENGIEGKVYIQFVVDEKGDIANAQVLRPVDASLDAEAIRVINSLPRFMPGMQNGKNVKVYYTAVINFQLH